MKQIKLITKSNYCHWAVVAFLFLLMLMLHQPFINADPDTLVSLNTRGAWTDEGLYTAQLRDYINHGIFNLTNNNGFIITPVFQLMIWPFYAIFGTGISVGRWVVLMFFLLVLIVLQSNKTLRIPSMLFLMLVGFQYHFFQFSHYGLGEVPAIGMVLLSLYALLRFEESKDTLKSDLWLVLAVLFSFLAYGIKIQFAYIMVLIPATLLFKSIIPFNQTKQLRNKYLKAAGKAALLTVLFAFLYWLIWYVPNSAFYNYIMQYETSERYKSSLPQILRVYRFNFNHILWVKELAGLFILGLLSVIGAVVLIILRKQKMSISLPLIFALLWLLAEQHKVAMIYLPTRYFLSLIAAAGLFTALILVQLFTNLRLKPALIIAIASLTLPNGIYNFNAYQRRTQDIKRVSEYLKHSQLNQQQPVLGIWAYTLAAASKAPTIGVRYNYLNSQNPVDRFNPQLIITEYNQAESDSTWAREHINLADISDSIKHMKVWRYDLDFYWIRQTSK